MSKETIIMYEAYINGDNVTKPDLKKVAPQKEMGYLGSIDDARKIFEKLYKNSSQPWQCYSTENSYGCQGLTTVL